MKKYLYLLLLLIFFVPIATHAASFSFSPTQTFEATCPAQIDVLIDAQGVGSNAADAYITYDPSDIVGTPQVTAGSAYESYVRPTVDVLDATHGLIKFTGFSIYSDLTSKGVYAHIQFTPKAGVANTTFGWDYVLGSTTDSNIWKSSDRSEILNQVQSGAYIFKATDGYCDEDKVPPTIDTEVPLPGSINQPLDSDVSFIIRDNRSGVDINSVVVKIINDGVTTQYNRNNSNFESALIDTGPNGEPLAYSISISPYPGFVSRKLVTVQVAGNDKVGNKGGGSWSFNEPQSDCESLGCSGPTTVCDQNLSLLATPGNKQVNLEWLPDLTILEFEKIIISRLECSTTLPFPTPSSGKVVYDNSGSFYTDVGLVNGVQYCYSAFAYRNENGGVTYSPGAFARATPNCYMSPITDFQVTGQDSGVMLSWKNPKVNNLGSIKIIRKENGCPNKWLPDNWDDGSVVYDGTGENFLDVNALPGSNFCYLAFAHSNDGCLSPGALKTTESVYTTSTDGFAPDYHYYTNSGVLELAPSNNNLDLLLNKDLTIITNSQFLKPVENIVASIGSNAYSLAYSPQLGQYSLRLDNFNKLGILKGNLTVVYTDQTIWQTPLDITVNPLGKIEDGISKKQIPGVEVVLVDSAGKVFVGSNQRNPLLTSNDGLYGFMIPNGRYRVLVRQNGQEKYSGAVINVTNNIVNSDIIISPAFLASLNNIIKALHSPQVQTANKYGALAVAALAMLNSIASIPWWNFWYYLQYLFTEFIPWLFKRKRKGWGIVYNSITKLPIDLAGVRLYDASTKKLLQSKITDRQGRYIFLAEAGAYYLEVYKPGYDFPSQLLKTLGEDKKYADLYHGEIINIKAGEKGAIIANIPLDQHEIKATDKQILREQFWQAIKNNISYVGPIFAIVALIISPGWLMASLTALHIILFLLFRRLARGKKVRSWGVVYDVKNRKPLAKSIARIFSPEYNRMLEAYVTDSRGRYGFLAGNNVYYITAEKDGYEGYKTGNIDLSKGEVKVVGKDMPLKPLDSGLVQPIFDEEVVDKGGQLVSSPEPETRDVFKQESVPTPLTDNADTTEKKEDMWG